MPLMHYKDIVGNFKIFNFYRVFFNICKSEVMIVQNYFSSALVVIKLKLNKVLQAEKFNNFDWKFGFKLYKIHERRINKASRKVRLAFTLTKIIQAYYNIGRLEKAIKSCSTKVKSIKLPLYKNFSNPCFLLIACSTLKNKKIDYFPIKNIKLTSIIFLSIEIFKKKYYSKFVKQIILTKVNKKVCSLGIVWSMFDIIIQQILKATLTPLFSYTFLNCFYISRSCHTALKHIVYNWCGVKWFIKFSFAQRFNKANSFILLSIFNKYVNDYWTSILINQILKSGCVCFGNFFDNKVTTTGIKKKFFLSSLFYNIFFYEFDICLEKDYKNNINFVKKNTKENKNYLRLFFYKNIVWISFWNDIQIIFYVTCDKLKKVRYCQVNFKIRKIYYIRYAGNCLFATISNKKFVYSIISYIALMLIGLNLKFNLKKIKIKHYQKGIFFLGYYIYNSYGFNIKQREEKNQLSKKSFLKLVVPLKKLFLRYTVRGFFQHIKSWESFKYVGKRQSKWLFFKSSYDIIFHFNLMIKSIKYFYAGSSYPSVLLKFWYAIKRSCALTLAYRFKQKSAKWAFSKFSKKLIAMQLQKKAKIKFFIPIITKQLMLKMWRSDYILTFYN